MNSLPGKPRGVLRPLAPGGAIQHERRLPCDPLSGLVEHFWHVRWDLRNVSSHLQESLPHPHVHLVVERGSAHIYGVHSARFERHLADQNYAFGIKFKPGGFYPFLKAPVSGLLNRSLPAQAVFGDAAQTLAQRVDACADLDAMVTAAIDKRSLQRLFQKYVGIGPKWVIQRYRLHEAIAQVQDGKVQSWAALSLDLGYFDQAHFVRDFHALVGQAPAEYARSLVSARANRPCSADLNSPVHTDNSGLLHHLR